MDYTNIFVIFFVIGQAFSFLLSFILEAIDFNFRKKHGTEVPEVLKAHVDFDTLKKTCRYEDAKYKFFLPKAISEVVLIFYLVFVGFFPALFNAIFVWTQNSFLCAYLFIVLSSIPSLLISLPFDLYSEFGIEKQFGFSKMTFGLWLADQFKAIILNLLILAPLLFAATALFKYTPNFWWLFLGIVYLAFSFGLSIIYPIFIAPIFNKFQPLEDGELKKKLEGLLVSCGFKASGLFVMDASRRSGHSNAYFTGFGKAKRVVLYDTLIEQLSVDEIAAVLAHELGHYKKHHIAKKMIFTIPFVFVLLFAISLLIKVPSLYTGFGFSFGNEVPYQMFVIGLFLLSLVFGEFTVILSPVTNFFSRKDEFQADAFSKELCGSGEGLTTALIKLNKENLSEIQVPKIYSVFYYTHPPLLERIKALLD